MVTITEKAWKRISELQSARPGVTVVRLMHKDGRVKCGVGVQRKLDRVIEHAGCPQLLMTPGVARCLSGRILDARDTSRGPRLRLKRISR
ncbi:hypothetical protein GC176_27865 [bacterium]|nr:hypothetical protein [bacterium]